MKLTPYKNLKTAKEWFDSAILNVRTKLPQVRKSCFIFWFHIKGLVNIHLEIPNLELWMGSKMNEDEKRHIRLFEAWIIAYIAINIIDVLKN